MDSNTKICANCGTEVSGAFCEKCGTKYTESEVKCDNEMLENQNENVAKKVFCQACGAQNSSSAKFCEKCGQPVTVNTQTNVVQNQNNITPQNPYINNSFGQSPVISQPKKSKKTALIIISILLVLSFIGNIALAILSFSFWDDSEYYSDKYWDLQDEYSDMIDANEFYDKYVRVIPDDGTNRYHRYTCYMLDKDASFWIYNKEAADDNAYPCQICCADD